MEIEHYTEKEKSSNSDGIDMEFLGVLSCQRQCRTLSMSSGINTNYSRSDEVKTNPYQYVPGQISSAVPPILEVLN